MVTHYVNDSATPEWVKEMSDIEHERELGYEILDTGTYPVLVVGMVRVQTVEEAKELLEEVA
jgi:hypothetical protein